ncbi:hypothetical protein [Nocardia jiangsuensis]|uniref:Uncharacterized protein n=1 Tax=Nocardia jiangsuensis TaxID=1691563 RepID=A0ABV8DLG7_9NOCA
MTTNSLAMYHLIAMTRQEAHATPISPLRVEQAHRIMQFHMACRARRCARKAAALNALIAAGRLIPDATKPQ